MAKVSRNYRQFIEVKKIAMGYTISETMSAKEKFAAYKPQLDKLIADLAAYQTATVGAALGGSDRVLAKKNCIDAVVAGLDLLAAHVEIMALTDETAIDDSGFQSTRTLRTNAALKAPITQLPTPENFKVDKADNSGAVAASCNKMEDVALYQVAYLMSNETAWVADKFSKEYKNIILTGFEKFARVKFKLRSISKKGVVSEWSNIVEVSVN